MSKKKQHHEEHEEHVNHEAWVIPYADMLTLLMALFLVMWATSQTDVNKMKQMSAGFADSLGIVGNGQGVGGKGVLEGVQRDDSANPDPSIKPSVGAAALDALENQHEQQQQQADNQQQLQDVEKQISATAAQTGTSGELAFKDESRGLIVSIASEGVLFDAGSAQILPAGRAVLDNLAATLNGLPNDIVIEGHTDNRPISTSQFPSNTYLSTARASAVLEYLVNTHHLSPSRVSAAGYGDQRPIASNADDAGRAKNRRVDIAILSQPVTLPPTTTAAPTTTVQIIQPIPTEGDTP